MFDFSIYLKTVTTDSNSKSPLSLAWMDFVPSNFLVKASFTEPYTILFFTGHSSLILRKKIGKENFQEGGHEPHSNNY